MTRVYLAGPMRGYPQYNFPAFDAAKEQIERWGIQVTSPADMDRTQKGFDPTAEDFDPQTGYDFDVADALQRDFAAIAEGDGIVFLPGWEHSTGANAERLFGQAIGLKAWLYVVNIVDDDAVLQPVSWEELEVLRARALVAPSGEHRVTDPVTGGQKGQKDVQLSMVPVEFLRDLGRVYAMGAAKYSRDNWRKGYAWSLSVDAMLRHYLAWRSGETIDPESGVSHLAHLAWHCATLHTFEVEGLGTDDVRENPDE